MYENRSYTTEIDIAAMSAPYGTVTSAQLRALGLGAEAIRYRLRSGRLYRVHAGVYAVGRPLRTPIEFAAAAVLACGDRAALGRLSGLAHWGMPGPGWPKVPVVIVAGVRRRRPGIEIHASATLARKDTRTQQGIRVTSPARTVLDCAPLLTPKQLRRAVNHGLRTHQLRRSQLKDVIARNRRHPGASRLAQLVPAANGNQTRSAFEDDFETFCSAYGLPAPLTNRTLAGYEVDAYFPNERVIVELDSIEFHLDPRAFEVDRERDAHHLALGIVTVRMTWKRINADPGREADRLHRILADRRRQAA